MDKVRMIRLLVNPDLLYDEYDEYDEYVPI